MHGLSPPTAYIQKGNAPALGLCSDIMQESVGPGTHLYLAICINLAPTAFSAVGADVSSYLCSLQAGLSGAVP